MSSLKSAPSDPTAKNAPAPEGMDEDTHDDSLLSDEPLDDASEHKMSQSEMKESDIKDLSAILQTQVTEEHAKTLFDRYNTNNNGTWSPHDLRLFLLDLQEAFGLPRVVPDEALADVLKELQLNIDAPGGVTWVEFKSYLLFLQQKPFEQLSELVQKYVIKSDLPNALLVTSLPAKVMKEHVAGVFANAGSIKQIFLVEERGPQALVIYQDARGAAEGLKLDGTELLGAKIVVVAYTNQDFPATVFKRKPSILAVGVAKAYVAAKNFDDKAKISVTLKQGYDTAGRKLESFAQEHKVKEKAQLVADKTNEAVKKVDERLKISEKASHLNEKYQISQKAAQAQEQAKRVADQVMANENVKAVGSFFSGIASRVQQSYTDFAQDTTEAIAEERRKSNAVEGGQQFPLQDAASAPKPQQ